MSFAVNLISARHLSVDSYGVVMLITALTLLSIGLQRAAFGEPLMILAESFKTRTQLSNVNRIVMVCCLLAGVTFAAAIVGVLYCYYGIFYIALISIAALFLSDAVRFISIANDRPYLCLFNTAICSIFQLGALGYLYLKQASEFNVYLVAWSMGALAGPVICIIFGGLFAQSKIESSKLDLTEFKKLSSRFSLDYFMGIVALQGSLWSATYVTGPAAAAALRGADTFLGPFRIFLQSMPALILKKWSQNSPIGLFGKLLQTIGKVWLLGVFWVLCFYLMPSEWGYLIMGKSWDVIQPVLMITLATIFPVSISALSLIALKAIKDTRSVLRTRFIVVPLGLILGAGGGYLGGAWGAAVGSLISSTIAAVIFYSQLKYQLRKLEPRK